MMNNRSLVLLVGFAVVAISVLFLIRLSPFMSDSISEKFLSQRDVRGSAVIHKGLSYTLNFEQQNQLLSYLNRSVPIATTTVKQESTLPYSKIVLYRFNASPVELLPIRLEGNNLIFSAPTWNPNGYLRDVSEGKLHQLLSTTYDS